MVWRKGEERKGYNQTNSGSNIKKNINKNRFRHNRNQENRDGE